MPQFTNQAQLSYNNTVVNSNVAVGELIDVVSITKTAVLDSYTRGNNITYVVSIVNSGDTPLTNITVTDDLGAFQNGNETSVPLTFVEGSALIFADGVSAAAPTNNAGPPLEFTGITVPANGNVILVYQAEANQFAPLDVTDSIVNTVTAAGEGIITPATASATVTPEQEPDLTITKTITPEQVTDNSEVTYSFLIQNFGNSAATAGDNASVTDTFDPILSDIAVTFDGAPWTEGTNYTYDETTGLFTTIPGQITVPPATFTQNPDGSFAITPGTSELVVTGTI